MTYILCVVDGNVALNHCRVLSNLKHSNLTLWLIIHSLNSSLHSHIAHDYSP